MLYLKERYSFPNNAVLSAPRKGEKAELLQSRTRATYAERRAKKADTLSMLEGKLDFLQTRLRATKARKKDTSLSRGRVYSIQLARLTLEFAQHGLKKVTGRPDLNEKKVPPDNLPNKSPKCLLKGMSFEDRSNEDRRQLDDSTRSMQRAQDCRYFTKTITKTDNALKNKSVVLNNLFATNKSLEKEVQCLKQIATDAVNKAKQLEKCWSEADLKWVEKEEELRNLRKMIQRFKAGEVDWPTPKPSEDEGSEDSEISSNEDEPEKNVEAEKTSSPTKDSFIEAMDAIKAEGTESIANTEEASSATKPNQGDLP
ncbi:hypothetical protein FNV43_RR13068 [Rhamnella rubrinervis]|uniref:Uncharacterized protein n=1 Tax=Rhamnella rubrinervis TaxID=2594499 RepID=A0A8K0H0C8_9ROSA|nr:hypothetical protein FNV43_RR13068 [Rhamnella rubrinervis]